MKQIMLFLFMAILPMSLCAQGKKLDLTDDETLARLELIAEALSNEVNGLIESKALLNVDSMQRYFELSDDQVSDAVALAKTEAKKITQQINSQLISFLLQKLSTVDQSTFTFNDKLITLTGEKEQAPFVNIGIKTGAWCTIRFEFPDTSSFTSIFKPNDAPFQLEQHPECARCLPLLTAQQLEKYKEHRRETAKKNLIETLSNVLAVELSLSNDQFPKMQDWLSNREIETQGRNLQDNLKRTIHGPVSPTPTGGLSRLDVEPEFLSEVQKKLWRRFLDSPQPLGY